MPSIASMVILLSTFSLFTFTFAIEVAVEQGKLSGTKLTSRNGNSFYAFYSIPYAKPPIGKLRFQPPQEPEEWTDVRNATTYPPACTQKSYFSKLKILLGQEDCLYLNVFTKKTDGNVPVLVFIHGGAFWTGTSSIHRANYLMDQDGVVLVTVNYRLGLLGFLSSGDESVAGNNGFKDQVMALKWIKKNIASFGGDPQNVVLFGHSAGAVSAHLHMFSPLSKGLFHKVICLSGVASNPWTTNSPYTMREHFNAASLLIGCSYKSTSEAVECLRKIPAGEIVQIQEKFFIFAVDGASPLGPAIEADTVSEPFLTAKPTPGAELEPKIPWLVGQTSAEGIFRVEDYLDKDGSFLKYLNDDYQRLLPIITLYKPVFSQLSKSSAFADELKKIYFQDREINLETFGSLVDLISDTYFTFGLAESALKYKGRRYLYYFSYKSRSGHKSPFDPRLTRLGVYHAEDLGHVFDEYANLDKNEIVTDTDDLKISTNWIKMLVQFAHTGDPNTNAIENLKWDPVGTNSLYPYLNISNDGLQLESRLYFQEKYEIWNSRLSDYFKE